MKKFTLLFVLLTGFLMASGQDIHAPDANGVLYVDAAAAGNAIGFSWKTAIPNLSDALRAAKALNDQYPGKVKQIWVARGTYTPAYSAEDGKRDQDGGRNNAFVLLKDIKIYGGFAGTEAYLADRDIGKLFTDNRTVLSGDIGIKGDNADNVFRVVMAAGEVGSAEINGFVITGGNGNKSTTITVNGESIDNNMGGGMCSYYSDPAVSHCIFLKNNSVYSGGGLYMAGKAHLSYCDFEDNQAKNGGGIYLNQADYGLEIDNCTFSGNQATDGGGIYDYQSDVYTLTNCIFSGNTAAGHGGGVYNNESYPSYTGCKFSDNEAGEGGGIYNMAADEVYITNCRFFRNLAGNSGGALCNDNSRGSYINSLFLNNKATNQGGGIYTRNASKTEVVNCTITGNRATEGGGIYNSGSVFNMFNSIIWGNSTGILDAGALQAGYCLVQTAYFANSGTANVNKDPLFMHPAAFDDPADSGDYHLQAGSPAIDAGTANIPGFSLPAADLDGNSRIAGGIPDMGAYERQPAAPNEAGVLFVNQAVTAGDGRGNSWENAIPRLADALRYAKNINGMRPGTIRQIWVAAGDYKPLYDARDYKAGEQNQAENDGGRYNALVLLKDVKIYGGFAGTEQTLAARDSMALFTTNQTILSGGLESGDSTFHVVIAAGEIGDARLDGFIIRDGSFRNDDAGSQNHNYGAFRVNNRMIKAGGAGLYITYASPVISHCLITGNHAWYNFGGGLLTDHAAPVIDRCTFSGNRAQRGGGMYNGSASSPVITYCKFTVNITDDFRHDGDTYGGAVCDQSAGKIAFINCIFSANEARSSGQPNNGTGGGGGAVYSASSCNIVNCLFSGNYSSSVGGALSIGDNNTVIAGCTIAGNRASNGAAVYYYRGSPVITNSIVWNNESSGNDDDIDGYGNLPVVSHSIIRQGQDNNYQGNGNINKDPRFIVPFPPSTAPTLAGNYHLLSESPAVGGGAIDTATYHYHLPATDLDGNPRVVDGTLGIGAYASAYIWPDSIRAVYDQRDTVRLTWDVPLPLYTFVSGDKFEVERSTDSTFQKDVVQVDEVLYDEDSTRYSMTDDLSDLTGGKQVYYRLRRTKTKDSWQWSRVRKTAVTVTINTSQKADTVELNNTKAGPEAVITWEPFRGVWTDETTFTIRKMDSTVGGTPDPITLTEAQARSGRYVDMNINYCHEYHYTIVVHIGNGFDSPPEIQVPGKVVAIRIGTIKDLSVSKGYFPDRTTLRWKTEGIFDDYIIKRSVYGAHKFVQVVTVPGSSIHDYSYDDEKGSPGVYYRYSVSGMVTCNNEPNFSKDTLYNIGFRAPTGTVYGRVTYETGQAVEGAEVRLEKNGGTQLGQSIYLNGSAAGYLALDSMRTPAGDSLFTVEAWIRPDVPPHALPENQVIFSRGNQYELGFNNNGDVYFAYRGDSVTAPYVNEDQAYIHIAGIHDGHTLTILAGDSVMAHKTIAYSPAADPAKKVYIGRNASGHYFKGYIDEMRLWNKAPGDSAVKENENRLLTGGEPGLVAYWRFDETIKDQFYDISHHDDVYNMNDGYMDSVAVTHSNVIPSPDQLGLKAKTDSTGNYMITGIPYTGINGTTYTIAPQFGLHRFDPDNVTRLFSAGSSTYTINFMDKSSYNVSGAVYYYNTTVPVPGVQFKIDGKTALDDKGRIIQSNAEGQFNISVPVGIHEVRAVKDNHIFVGAGRITDNHGKDRNYQSPVSGLNVYDSTTVRFIGRVAGGAVQEAYPLGHSLSKNNLGKTLSVKLTLSTKAYLLSKHDTAVYVDHFLPTGQDSSEIHRSRVVYHPYDITIYPDPETGEFAANLIPVKFYIDSVNATGWGNILTDDQGNNKPVAIDLSDKFLRQSSLYTNTSLKIDGKPVSDTVFYNASHVFTKRVDPTFTIQQLGDNREPLSYFGDKTYEVQLMNNTVKTLQLLDLDKTGMGQYLMGRPVFRQNSRYTFTIKSFESYPFYIDDNKDIKKVDGEEVIDRAPTQGAKVTIYNDLDREGTKADTLNLDAEGTGDYTFYGGEPDFASGGVRDFSAEVQIGATHISWQWLGQPSLRAFVLGGKETGTNFITAGPKERIAVLRDPPGNRSFSSIGKNLTYTTTSTYSGSVDVGQSQQVEDVHEHEVVTFEGEGFGTITEQGESKTSGGLGLKEEAHYVGTRTKVTTTTFTTDFRTSDDPAFVGAPADLFVGYATNLTFGESRNLIIIKADELRASDSLLYPHDTSGEYLLVERDGINSGLSFQTMFAYPQQHIVKVLIPELIRMRNVMLLPKGTTAADAQKKADKEKRCIYVSKIDVSDQDLFGRSNDDDIFGPDAKVTLNDGPSYHIYKPQSGSEEAPVDSVYILNQDIASWEAWLRDNEIQKVAASLTRANLIKNYSFHAGSPVHYSEQYTITRDTSNAFSVKILGSGSLSEKGTVFGEGIKLTFKQSYGTTQSGNSGQTEDSTASHGFTLAADGTDEYLSVDVTRANDGSFVFVTKGGVTGCPYEGKTMTQYLKPSQQIGQPTMQIERPDISADHLVANNVPSTRSASYQLYLKNESEARLPVNLVLSYANTDSVKGAFIAVDGSSLAGGGRTFAIPYGQTVTKVLTITKGPDAMDYNDIPIILHSSCQYDVTGYQDLIADTVLLSAHFVPSCSDIHVVQPEDQWILNSGAPVNAAGNHYLPVTLNNFDISNSLFDHIELQYKPSATSQWRPVVDFYADEARYDAAQGTKAHITDAGAIHYDLEMDEMNFPDQPYDIRALSVCDLGAGHTVTTASNVASGLKDTYIPRRFGSTQPANGILGAGDDIRVNFNEPIAAGLLKPTDVVATGIRNGTPNDHSVSVRLDGKKDYVVSEFDKNLSGRDITVAMWVLPDSRRQETLFSQGNINESMEMSFTGDNYLEVTVGKRTIRSDKPLHYEPDNWEHVALVYHAADSSVSAFYNYEEVIHRAKVQPYQGVGPFEFGRSISKKGDYYAGKMQDIQVWTKDLSSIMLQQYSNERLSGSENALLAYYPMTEGKGNIIFDKAHGNNASLTGAWNTPAGKAVALNGNGYVKIKTGAIPVTADMDYTMGLWFKADPGQANATLVSNGKGDGTDAGAENIIWLGFRDGRLTYLNNGFEVQADSNYLDNRWHHVAVTVNRSAGTARLLVDGQLQQYFDAGNLGGISSADIYLGARVYYEENDAVTPHFDQYFKGEIDEYRLWNTYLEQSYLKNNNNIRLEGDEKGLLAYYPFERYENGFIASTLLDERTDTTGTAPAAALVNAGFTDEMAPIKDRGPVAVLNSDFVINGNSLIINLKEEPRMIDKTIVNFQVSRVFDQHGNEIASPVTWSAYIDQNPLRWSDDALNLSKDLYKPMQFGSYIVNSGGKEEKFSIGNLPPWLTADITSGTVPPEGKQKITFTINEGLNVGSYDDIIEMTNDLQETQGLALNLTVSGQTPDWKVNPADFAHNMTIYGKLRINHIFSDNPEDILAAFIDGKCVGLTHNTYLAKNDLWYTFLTVYSDSLRLQDDIEFRIWDAGTGKIYQAIPAQSAIRFVSDTIIGTSDNPVIFDGQELLFQNIRLNKGWNWISFNLHNRQLNNVNATLANGTWLPVDEVKHDTAGFDNYSSTAGWVGTLPGFDNISLFKLKTATAQVLSTGGTRATIDTTHIPVSGGRWNYISYLPQVNMTVEEALAGYQASDQDVLKSQTGFTMYSKKNGWVGNLTYLEPGKGYMLYRKAGSATKFVYPVISGSLATHRLAGNTRYESARLNPYQAPVENNFRFADNMTVVAAAAKGFTLLPGDKVLAYAGADLRGEARPVQDPETGRNACFFNIPGNDNRLIHFEVERNGKMVAETGPVMSYMANGMIGTLSKPFMLHFGKPDVQTGIYPNPFHDAVTVHLTLPAGTHEIQMAVYDVNGRPVAAYPKETTGSSAYQVTWKGRNGNGLRCSAGIYFIHLLVDGISHVYKVVKY